MMLTACSPPAIHSGTAGPEAIARGEAAAERLGCGACHMMPGVEWPQGRVGPPLAAFGDRALIAGELPNQPALLAAFVRDAPSLMPETTMPAIPMSERDARDIAAWLSSLHDE
jgi:cytochrome c1